MTTRDVSMITKKVTKIFFSKSVLLSAMYFEMQTTDKKDGYRENDAYRYKASILTQGKMLYFSISLILYLYEMKNIH